jgi:hypothetical protein
MVPGPRYGSASPQVSIPVRSIFFAAIVTIAIILAIAGWLNNGNLTFCTQCYRSPTEDLVCFVRISGETEQLKLQNTPQPPPLLSPYPLLSSLPRPEQIDPHRAPQQQQMPRRTIIVSQPYLSPTQRAAVERASPAALAQFQRLVREQDIPYWGPNCVIWVLDLADKKF